MTARRIAVLLPAAALAFACVAPDAAMAAVSAPLLSPTGPVPQAVRTADLDGDCVDEIVVGSATGLEVMVQTATGGHVTAWRDDTLPPVTDLELADLDGDGDLDLVAAHRQGDRLTVHLGDGGAAFTLHAELPTARGPNAVAIADVDGDGTLDLVTAHQLAGTVGVFTGDGAGAFTSLGEVGGFTLPWDVAAADLDGDGDVDLVVTDYFADAIVRLRGDGTGAFVEDLRRTGLGGPLEVAISPDGPFVVTIARDAAMLVTLDGALATLDARSTGPDPGDLHLGEVVGDGWPDAIVTDAVVADVRVYPGRDGGFDAPVGAPLLVPARAASSGDLDGDAVPDVVAVIDRIFTEPNGWAWIAHRGPVPGIVTRHERLLDTEPDAAGVFEVTGDDLPDLLVGGGGDPSLHLYAGNGTHVAPGIVVPLAHPPAAFDTADMNGDGRADLVVAYADHDSIGVYAGGTDGTFARIAVAGTPPGPTGLHVAPLDGDPWPDAVTTHERQDVAAVFLGDGTGGLVLAESFPGGNGPIEPAVVDVDGDGIPDVVIVARVEGAVRVHRGRGDGTLEAPVVYDGSGLAVGAAVYDATGDGIVDLFTAAIGPEVISVWPGDGKGGFGAPISVAVPVTFDRIALADVDDDAIIDAILIREPASRIAVRLGRADGTFPDSLTLDGGIRPDRVIPADIDGDGRSDLVVVRRPATGVHVATVLPGREAPPRAPAESVAIADVAAGVEVRVRLSRGTGVTAWGVSRRVEPDGAWLDVHEAPVEDRRELEWLDEGAREPGGYRYRVWLTIGAGAPCEIGEALVFVPSRAFALAAAAPSPFGDRTALRITLPPGGGETRVDVFDIAGRRVARLVDRRLPAGSTEIVWGGRTEAGHVAGPGVYWVRATAGGRVATARVVVAR